MSKVIIALDATMLDTFETCECKFDYRFNKNKSTTEKAKPLDKGSLIHIGLETYYKALKEQIPYQQAVDMALVSVRVSLATDSDLSSADGNLILDTIEQNLDHWRVADQSFTINQVEKSFAYVLYEDDTFKIIMIGKIDLIVSDNQYTNLPFDHKSYERERPLTRLTNQFQNYAKALNSNYLIVNRVGLQKTLKAHEKFKRVPLSYDHLILEQWRQNTIKVVMKYYDCVDLNSWPMNLTSCDKYNRLCEYHEVCDTSGEENKTYKLNVNFKTVEPWDVSKILGSKE